MNVADALNTRLSINNFDTTVTISHEEITTLVTLAQQAPSSFNIQFTRFVAVTDAATKEALRGVAYGQPKVSEASAVIVLCGDLKAQEAFAVRTRAAAAAGHLAPEMAERMVGMSAGMYGTAAALREESIRSVGLSGMAFMLAAEERGWVTGPMIGFDPAGVSGVLGLTEQNPPLMLITIGKPAAGNWPRKARLGADVVLRFNKGDF